MNLHDIRPANTDMRLLADYCSMYYDLTFDIDEDGTGLIYWLNRRRDGRISHMNEHTAHGHLTSALAWDAAGRPRIA